MTTYTLIVEIPQAGKEVQCEVNLTGSHENNPEDYFRQAANRQVIRSTLQTQLQREIQAHHVDGLISQWIQGIKRGKVRLKRQLDLHLNTDQVQATSPLTATPIEPGSSPRPSGERSQSPSQPFYPPKPPRPIQPPTPQPSSTAQARSPQKIDNPQNAEDPETESISIESISNTADF